MVLQASSGTRQERGKAMCHLVSTSVDSQRWFAARPTPQIQPHQMPFGSRVNNVIDTANTDIAWCVLCTFQCCLSTCPLLPTLWFVTIKFTFVFVFNQSRWWQHWDEEGFGSVVMPDESIHCPKATRQSSSKATWQCSQKCRQRYTHQDCYM